MAHAPNIGKLVLLGGRPCLDFINTFAERNTTQHEWLHSYDDLIRWSVHAGTITQTEADHLLSAAKQDHQRAASVLNEAIQFRESIYEILRAVIDQRDADPEQIALFNRIVGDAMGHLGIAPANGAYAWDWQAKHDLDYVLWPLARSAADLITSPDLERVHQCPGCNWLFLDQSRNRSRTWCGMQWCGNRAKARRHYERRVAGSREPRGSADMFA